MAIPDKPLNRIEKYLAKWAGDTVSIPAEPLNRLEKYLAKIAGQNVQTPTPLCRIEDYLDAIIGNIQWTEITNQSVATFTSAIAAELPKLKIAITPVQSGSGDPAPDNVRPISGWTGANVVVSPTQSAEDGTTYPVTWQAEAGTVYDGEIELVSGELTDKARIYTFNGTESITYTASGAFKWSLPNAIAANPKGADSTGLCTHYELVTDLALSEFNLLDCVVMYSNSNLASGDGICYIRDSRFPDAVSYKAWLAEQFAAGTPLQIVYLRDEDATYQLPGTPITTLKGVNNIWADTGDVLALTYREA